MKIGIDARLIDETGVGRYIRNLVGELAKQDTINEYVIFLPPRSFSRFVLPNIRWSKVRVQVHWHTVSEQIIMPRVFAAAHVDIVHIPYHNPPILYGGRMVITIHDLTILHFSTGKATTLPLPLYYLKRLGYWLELWIALWRASHVIAVSEVTKQEIIDHFHVPSEKITVTYEGVDPAFMKSKTQTGTRLVSDPYFLYVGNAYPHKNIEKLLLGFKQYIIRRGHADAFKLVLVGADDFFYRRMQNRARQMGLVPSVLFFGPADDAQLINLYTHAAAFVFPSLMEGFGLPALEAVSLGCRVCVSDIPVFHEILGSHAVYFDANSSEGIAQALKDISAKPDTNGQSSASVRQFLSKFSWKRMTEETRSIYERCISV